SPRGRLLRACSFAIMYILINRHCKPECKIRLGKAGRNAAMTAIHAETALLPQGLARDVRIVFSGNAIASVETGVEAQAGDERHGFVMPAMPNLHSHAFQRAMAGLAETRGHAQDSFWSWRTAMYRFALSMTTDHVEAV